MRQLISLGLALCSLVGCVEAADTGADSSNIIGGVDASSPTLDAIGTVGTQDPAGGYRFHCTATLIAPQVVVTAKHCAITPYGTTRLSLEEVFFAVGPNAFEPQQLVQASDVELAPLDQGGMVKLGSDIAIYHLVAPVEGVQPLGYLGTHLPATAVGTTFTAVGFGVQDDEYTMGSRQAGVLTLQAVAGQPIHAIFPTEDELLAYLEQYETSAWFDTNRDRIDEFYDFELLAGHEAYAGMGPDDAQPCSGDSGGPLVADIGGQLTVVGVVSGSFKTNPYSCSRLGEAYATFGETVQPLLAAAVGPDVSPVSYPTAEPCDGLDEAGRCDGSVLERCVSEEGSEEVVRTDCAAQNQICAIVDGGATCVAPS